jgi:hypothetical protein
MEPKKCPECHLVNFPDAKSCKRCKADMRPRRSGEPRSTACPKCRSSDTQSFRMAYQTGTSKGSVRMGTYSEDGGFGLAGGNVSTQTMLAGNVQPPVDSSRTVLVAAVAFCSLAVFIIAVLLLNLFAPSSYLGLVGFLLICPTASFGAGFLAWRSGIPKVLAAETELRKAMHKWSHSWICLRCGKDWVIS